MVDSQYSHLLPELREAVKDSLTKFYDNDYTLLHWLETYKGDMDKIVPKLESHLDLRKAMNLDAFNLMDNPAFNDLLSALRPYLPKNMCENKEDKNGNIVQIDCLGQVDTKILEKVKQSDFLRFQLVEAEMSRRHQLEHEQKQDKLLGYAMIYDLGELNLGSIGMDAVSGGFARITSIVSENFPGRSSHVFVVNASTLVSSIWAVVRLLLSTEVTEKVSFLSANFKEEILEFFDRDQIPVAYGGILTGDKAECHVETMVRAPKPLPDGIVPSSESFSPAETKDTYVSPGYSVFFDVNVTKGQTVRLKWFFEANGDLDYLAYFVAGGADEDQGGIPIIPKFRLTTTVIPETGELDYDVMESGVMTFEVENQSGYFMSTYLKYSVEGVEVSQANGEKPLEVIFRDE